MPPLRLGIVQPAPWSTGTARCGEPAKSASLPNRYASSQVRYPEPRNATSPLASTAARSWRSIVSSASFQETGVVWPLVSVRAVARGLVRRGIFLYRSWVERP